MEHRSFVGAGTNRLNRSIRGKLIVGVLVILLVIVSVLTFVLARSAATLLEKESSNQLSQLLDQSTSILSNFLQARAANLGLWASEPLIHSVANDPALGAIFSLGLRDYFDTHIAKKPWIENIFLIKDGAVVYTQFESFLSQSAESNAETEGFRQLLALPSDGVTAINLNAVQPDLDRGVITMKRQLSDETGPMEGVFILLLLNLENIQHTLFGKIKAGTNGFLALTADLRLPTDSALWIPAQEVSSQPERMDFLAAHAQELLLSGSSRRYQSIIIDHRKHIDSPLAIVGVAALRDVREPVLRLIYFAVGCGFLAIVVGIVSIFIFSGRLTAPIRELTAKAHEFASNRLGQDKSRPALTPSEVAATVIASRSDKVTFELIDSRDEVGELASVFQLLDQRTIELEHANTLLGQRNQEIDQAMQTLQQTQSELVTNLERLERELAAARRLQLSMVPSVFPAITASQPVDIYALMEPAREVGGDLYDFFYADDNILCFLVGDVSDKGTSAALFMARTRSLIRFAADQWREATGQIPEVGQIMRSVNRELCQDNKARMFVTLFLGLLDVRSGIVQYANGGHVMPFRLGAEGVVDSVGGSRPDKPLGVSRHSEYRNMTLTLQSQEMLFLYTDGIPEAMNVTEQFYSNERLQTKLQAVCAMSPKDAIATLKQDVDAFVGDAAQFDDVTLLALRWRPLLAATASPRSAGPVVDHVML